MTETLTCARHGEPTGLRCVSCETPVCPRCMVRTEVGQRCEGCGEALVVPGRRAPAPASRARSLAMVAGAGLVVVAAAVVFLRPSASDHRGTASAVEDARPAGSWEEAPPLATVRGSTAAVTLADGTVLVAGGGVSAIPVAAAEVFDPGTGAWRQVAPMAEARRGHQAALLGDGRVLVAGGVSAAGALASAEVFDPERGAWSGTGPMGTPRLGHTLTVLADGRVLAAGGAALDSAGGGVTPLATTELYDPATGRWTPGPAMTAPRFEHTATPLDGGRVLLAGGVGADGGAPVATAELYDPAAGVFVAAAPMAGARTNHAAARLDGQRVLVVGGAGGPRADTALRSAEVFDARRNTWSRVADLARARTGATATALPAGTGVLVAGGEAVDGGLRRSLADAERYDPAAGRWAPAGSMACPRSEQAAAPLGDGGVLVVAGDGAFPGQPPVAQGCADRYHPTGG